MTSSWGISVARGSYAGHDGLQYSPESVLALWSLWGAPSSALADLGTAFDGGGTDSEFEPEAGEDKPALILFTSGTPCGQLGHHTDVSHRRTVQPDHAFPHRRQDRHDAGAVRPHAHSDFDSYDLSSLRSWPLRGAPVSTELLDRIRAKLPNLRERGLSNTWGMTEAGGFLTVADGRDLLKHPGTVGRPYPVVELKIDHPDEDGSGEVLARSPTVMLGYAGDRSMLFAQALIVADDTVDSDGWLHTGDLGHINDDGYLFIDGRRKDIVIRGGENIACPQVEVLV